MVAVFRNVNKPKLIFEASVGTKVNLMPVAEVPPVAVRDTVRSNVEVLDVLAMFVVDDVTSS